jgi:hypothetical protein
VARRPPRGFKSWSSYNARRVERGRRLGLSRAQALGHPAKDERAASEIFSETRWVATFPSYNKKGEPALVTIETDFRAFSRARRFNALGKALREARITPEEYRRRARRYQPIGGYQPLADPRAVLALYVTSTTDEWIFESGRQRPRRTRSSR